MAGFPGATVCDATALCACVFCEQGTHAVKRRVLQSLEPLVHVDSALATAERLDVGVNQRRSVVCSDDIARDA